MFKRSVLSNAVALAIALSSPSILAQADGASSSEELDDALFEEVVVTGIRASLTKAIEIKRSEMQIIDAIVAEDIGKFPDNNVVEALQRVTGVQTTARGAGEVSAVTIRGLGDVSTTVNGRQIFTGVGRSVALQDIPASLLNRVDVYKTRSADQIEGGIAGQIDVHTHRPFNFDDRQITVAARGIYADNSGETDPALSMLLSDRWEVGGGEVGALLNVSYSESNYRDENIWVGAANPHYASDYTPFGGAWERGLDDGLPHAAGSTLVDTNGEATEYVLMRDAMGFTDFTGKRKRPAANISLQWAPNENSEYLMEGFYNGYRDESFNSLVFMFVNSDNHFSEPQLFPGTNIVKRKYINDANMFTSGDGATGKTDSYVFTLGGKWDLSDTLSLESEVVYQESTFERSFFAMQTTSTRDRLIVDFNAGDGLPLAEYLDDPATDIDEGDLTRPEDWAMSSVFDNGGQDKGDAFSWNLDGDWDVDLGLLETLSFGVRHDIRNAAARSWDQSANTCVDTSQPDEICRLENFDGLVNINPDGFFNDEAQVPQHWLAADGHWLLNNESTVRDLYSLEQLEPSWLGDETFDITETTTAAYLQADYSFDLGIGVIDGQIGVRATQYESELTFGTETGGSSSTTVLPSFLARYSFTDDLMTRFSYGETISRPAFGELNPTRTKVDPRLDLDHTHGSISSGNPALEPVESANIDWSLEWYFAESSSLYGVLFWRDVEGFIFSASRNVVEETVDETDPPGTTAPYSWTQPTNAGKGKLNGLEIGFQWFPENVHEYLQGIGIQASYTALDGETKDPIYETPEDGSGAGELIGYNTTPLYNVSDSSYSLVLSYERDKFDVRLSYVYRDDFLASNNRGFAQPALRYAASEESMDFQVSYDITDDWVVTFDATNLTNPVYQSYWSDPTYWNDGSSIYSPTFALGTRFSF